MISVLNEFKAKFCTNQQCLDYTFYKTSIEEFMSYERIVGFFNLYFSIFNLTTTQKLNRFNLWNMIFGISYLYFTFHENRSVSMFGASGYWKWQIQVLIRGWLFCCLYCFGNKMDVWVWLALVSEPLQLYSMPVAKVFTRSFSYRWCFVNDYLWYRWCSYSAWH